MIKLIVRLIGLLIIGGIIFLALSLWQGGKPFRWFGEKTEHAGEVIKEKSKEVGNEADKIKEKKEYLQSTSKKIKEGIKKTGDKIKDMTGSKDEK
jgi:hypothetical protein